MRRFAFGLLVSLWCSLGFAAGLGPAVFVNEIHYDNTGTDAGEFIEIAGPAGTDLSSYSLVLYNGANGAAYNTRTLSGTIPDQQNGYGTVAFTYAVNGIQNGDPDGLALVQGTTVIQFLSYEGTFTAVGGPASGMSSTDIGVREAGTEPVGQSLQLQGSGTNYGDFAWSSPITATAGAVNTGQSFAGGGPVLPTLSVNDVTVTEGNGGTVTASFTVTLNAPYGSAVTFDIATADGSAQAGSDYVARVASGSIAAGGTAYTFDVAVNGDTVAEPNETFLVNLSNASNANIAAGQGTGTILNDDIVAPPTGDVVISQVYGGGGNSGAPLNRDFVELLNRGTSPVSLSGWSVQYASASGSSWSVAPLSGSIQPGHYFLVALGGGSNGSPLPDPDVSGSLLLAAASGKVALATVTTPLSGACPAASVADLVGYGSANCSETAPTTALSNTNAAMRANFGCTDTNDNSVDFAVRSPFARNSSSAAVDCSVHTLTIPAIQGNGAASPFTNKIAETDGVVTAIKYSGGFFIQDPAGDGDPSTSDGLFVALSGTTQPVAVGDRVRVTGAVSEYFGLTEISPIRTQVVKTGTAAVPAAVAITSTTDRESVEAMLVRAESLVTVSPSADFGEVYTVFPGVPRPAREPGLEASADLPPGAPATIPRFDENPERLVIDMDGLAGATVAELTSNMTLGDVTGPFEYAFGTYRILPNAPFTQSAPMSPVAVPSPAPNEFTIGSFNLLNFNSASGDFPVRLAKASAAIRNMMHSPDIVGVEEMYDIETLTALADRINSDSGAANPQYQAFLLEGVGDQFGPDIDVGFLVRSSRVEVVSVTQFGKGETFIDPRDGSVDTLFERPPLVLKARIQSPTGSKYPVTVMVNHPQSLLDVADPANGERARLKRQLQAEFTANLVQQLQAAGDNLVLVGDFNSYQFSDGYVDVIGTIKGTPAPADEVVLASPDLVEPDLTALINTLPGGYSYVFEGNTQALDHVLASQAIMPRFSRYAIAHNDADFPATWTGSAAHPERVSDHDMPVAYFSFPPPAADLSISKSGPASAVTGSTATYTIVVTNAGPDNATGVVVADLGATLTPPSGWSGTLAIGASATFLAAAEVPCQTADGAAVTNTASVSSAYADPDPSNNSDSAVLVASNPAPVVAGLAVDKPVLGPVNHKMIDVALSYSVDDNCGAVTTTVAVTSNQAVNGTGDGDTSPDWIVVDDHHVQLRAERAGTSDEDRIYTITVTVTDSAGGSTSSAVTVRVPKSAR